MTNSDTVYTAITFSPVTEFIEKTRKLRDLYGSSFILSYLADSVCCKVREQPEALGLEVLLPVELDITMGIPDQIVIQGDFPEEMARKAFFDAWGNVMDVCQMWVCENCRDWIDAAHARWVKNKQWHDKVPQTLPWDRDWQQWKNHAWEFFWVKANSIPEALDALAEVESNSRNWVGINWIGESSTLSGADAIAWPGLDRNISAKRRSQAEDDKQIKSFFQELNLKIGAAILEDDLARYPNNNEARLQQLLERYPVDLQQRPPEYPEQDFIRAELAKSLGEAIIAEREQLSIPELTKRLSTLSAVAQDDRIKREIPASFRSVNLWETDRPMGWFQGDGDRVGQHMRHITKNPSTAPGHLKKLSTQMRGWVQWLMQDFDQRHGRIIFAGGDDFLGVFYPSETPTHAINWLCDFKECVWHEGETDPAKRKPVTPSVGFVWASPQIPQRDVLQHCERAERKAKDSGRDRVCLRVLFASGNYVDWTCPWWFLPKVVLGYRDRNQQRDWTHFYKDVAALEARHAFDNNHQIALALFNLFFTDPQTQAPLLPTQPNDLFKTESPLWTQPGTPEPRTGLLNDTLKHRPLDQQKAFNHLDQQQKAFNRWVITLAKVGFQLFNPA